MAKDRVGKSFDMDDSVKKPKASAKSMKQKRVPKGGEFSSDLPDWLQHGLHDLYRDILNEPLPKEFEELLRQLEETETSSK